MPAECPDDEALAAFVERRAPQPAIVEEHIDTCAACRMAVAHLAALRVDSEADPGPGLGAETTRGSDPDGVTATGHLFATHAMPVPPVPVGAKLDRYVVQRELGRGGMGLVLEAQDPELDRRIALKIVRPGSDDPLARERLLREARAMARLAHPNVVMIHDVGALDDGRVFLAMELVAGTTLRKVFRAGRRPLAETLDLFVQAGRGLAAAHAAGLVHRDFKPDNVLVGNDGRVRVTDFGLARGGIADDEVSAASRAPPSRLEPSALTATGSVMGTPAYMAPEQHLGEPARAHADQFAFAVALFEALAETRAFPGDTYEAIATLKLEGDHAPWPPDCAAPAALRAIVDRALSRLPSNRFPTMDALLASLTTASAHAPALAPAPAPALAPAPAPAPALAPAPAPAPRDRRIAVLAALTGLAIAISGTAAAIAVRSRDRTTPSSTTTTTTTPCPNAASAIAPAWSPSRSVALARALADRGVPQPVSEATLSTLDAHARAWTATHETSCRATRVDHTQTEALYLARAACLRRRRAELYETVEVLTRGTAAPEEAFALHPLGSIAACDDVKTLAASDPPPGDRDVSARLDELHSHIARLRAAPTRGRALEALVAAAGATGLRAAHAEATLLKGETENDDRLLREALLAAEASRDDELTARARVALVRVAARSGATEQGERAASALAALARHARPELEADVHEAIALAELRRANFRAARAEVEQSQQLRAASPPSCGRLRGVGEGALALARLEAIVELGDAATAPEALKRARDALALEGARPETRARLEVLAGRIALADGKALEALATFDLARDLARTGATEVAELLRATASASTSAGVGSDRVLRARKEVIRQASAEAKLFGARARIPLERAAEAERDLEELLRDLRTEGFNLEPIVESRVLGDLARLASARPGAREATKAFERASRAVELVGDDRSPVLAEALLALADALVAQGKARDALVPAGRADVIARGGPIELRADCAAAFAHAALAAARTDATAVPRAREVVRRVIGDAPAGSGPRAKAERALATLD